MRRCEQASDSLNVRLQQWHPGQRAGEPNQILERTLKVVQGQGKLILAACTPAQLAYESPSVGHGLLTASLLRGLRGDAKHDGEVTINSLYDFIDRQMGSERQRPMMFAQPHLQSVFHEPRDVGTGFSGLRKDSLGFWPIKPHLPRPR